MDKQILSIATETLQCALSWEPNARLLGNVKAEEIVALCNAVLASAEIHQELTVPKLLALVGDMEGALLSGAEFLQEWGGYVDPYFKRKHAFDADVAYLQSHAKRARDVISGKDIMEEMNDQQ